MNQLAKLTRREEVAAGTMSFHFEKPPGFTFKPGQYMRVTHPDPPETDPEGNRRTFTIASAPHEPTLMLTTRLRDTAFKRVLKGMPLGGEVLIEGPFGNLVLHQDEARPAVFLAGGIGVTPFRSIVLDAAAQKRPHRIFLFYSNRRPEEAAFLAELRSIEQQNPNYTLVPTMTDMEKSQRPWQGETARVNAEMLRRYLPDVSSPLYYIAGPPAMVTGLRAMLAEAGISSADIRSEKFAGY